MFWAPLRKKQRNHLNTTFRGGAGNGGTLREAEWALIWNEEDEGMREAGEDPGKSRKLQGEWPGGCGFLSWPGAGPHSRGGLHAVPSGPSLWLPQTLVPTLELLPHQMPGRRAGLTLRVSPSSPAMPRF